MRPIRDNTVLVTAGEAARVGSRAMRLLLVAPPGAGKGTQAARLADHYGIANLSSGELLRQEIAADSEVGRASRTHGRSRRAVNSPRLTRHEAKRGGPVVGNAR
jgi:hypothetical protein